MSFQFGDRSMAQLSTCHRDLIRVANAVIAYRDFSVIEGYRTIERQQALFAEGRTLIDGVVAKGMHNHSPSLAFDLLPYPYDLHGVNIWDDKDRLSHFAGIVLGTAKGLGIRLRWGGDWDGDGSTRNHRLVDYPHFELQ